MPVVFEQAGACHYRRGRDLQRVAGPLGALFERLECGVTNRAKATTLTTVPHRFRNAHTSSHTQGQPRLATWLTIRSLRRPERRPSVRPRAGPNPGRPSQLRAAGDRSSSGVVRPCSPTDALESVELRRSRCQGARPSLGRRAILRCVTERGHLVDSLEPRPTKSRWAATVSICVSADTLRPPAASVITRIRTHLVARGCACCPSNPRHVRGRSICRSGQAFESFAHIWSCVIAGFGGSPLPRRPLRRSE